MRVLIIFAALAIASTGAEWDRLQSTFEILFGGFYDNPRTQAELEDAGWTQISTCESGLGDRWVRDPLVKDLVLLFDGNGFIAGIQSPVPFDKVEADVSADSIRRSILFHLTRGFFSLQYFDYANSQWYTAGTWADGSDAYYATAYFVDPSIICNGGRTQEEFDEQGTGYTVLFQNGPTSNEVLEVPMTLDELTASVSLQKCGKNGPAYCYCVCFKETLRNPGTYVLNCLIT